MRAFQVNLLSYLITNQPGEIGKSTGILAQNDVNIEGLYAEEAAGQTIVNVVPNSDNAATVLEEAGFIIINTKPIIKCFIGAGKGTVSHVSTLLGKAGVNIEAIFGAACPKNEESQIFLEVNDLEKGLKVLNEEAQ